MQSMFVVRRYVARTLAGALFAALFTFGIGTATAAAVLEVTKTPVDGAVAAGTPATFTITVKNTGDEPSDFVRLIDLLPGLRERLKRAAGADAPAALL